MDVAVTETPDATSQSMLSVRITKRFAGNPRDGFALHADFEAAPGTTILFGASGAGKTTILDCIAGLQAPDEGSIRTGEAALFDSAANINLPPNRRRIAYLLQTLALFPHMSVEQNVRYGLANLDAAERERRIAEILESFHISTLARRRPSEISGGERQRVALARALVTRPRVLLLDEPLTALDKPTKARIIEDLRAWNQQFRIPILYVTHDREEVFALGERMLVLENGRIVAQGLPHDVLQRPELESVAQLAGFENVFDCTVDARNAEQGTMSCRIAGTQVELEVPLTRVVPGRKVRVGIRAGDIMLATAPPQRLSARNVISGEIRSLERRDVMVIARVDCGAIFEVHLTLGAVRSLALATGSRVWLVLKTYSCRVLQ
jgi:molybdate transport system ATP-binding protein